MNSLDQKSAAAAVAAKLVADGQIIGLGSGSTAELAIREIGMRIKAESLGLIGIPTSNRSESIGREVGIPISSLDEHDHIDMTIDGADEVDPSLNLIKGLGGALLREKIVAEASGKVVIVVDDSKLADRLGTRAPLPVEIIQFSHGHIEKNLSKTGCDSRLRMKEGAPYITDNGNYIADCFFEKAIPDPEKLEVRINEIPGVVETGLFLGIADMVIVANEDGVRTLEKK